jgi:tetratricopeptide (TPR) repeat protein
MIQPVGDTISIRESMMVGMPYPTIYCWIGHTYRAERDYTNAIGLYQKTLECRPQHAWAFGALKETYEALGDYEKSLDYAELGPRAWRPTIPTSARPDDVFESYAAAEVIRRSSKSLVALACTRSSSWPVVTDGFNRPLPACLGAKKSFLHLSG